MVKVNDDSSFKVYEILLNDQLWIPVSQMISEADKQDLNYLIIGHGLD